MINLKKYLALFMAFCMGLINLTAQDTIPIYPDTLVNPAGGVLEVNEVEVIKEFEAKLIDASKISLKPELPKVTTIVKKYNYEVTIVPINIEYPDPIIRPLAMNPDPSKNVDHIYAKLGYTTLNMPSLDLSFYLKDSDEKDLLVSAQFEGGDDAGQILKRQYYKANLGLQGGYRIGENNKIKPYLSGGYHERYTYDTAFVNTFQESTDLLKRNAFDIDGGIVYENIETTDNGLDYYIGFHMNSFSLTQTEQDALETTASLKGGVSKELGDKFSIDVDVIGEQTNLENAIKNDNQRLTVLPGISFSSGIITLSAKADLFVDNNGTHPFADINLGVSILNNTFQIFAGIDQIIETNQLKNRFHQNPFVTVDLDSRQNTITKQYFGGVRGAIHSYVKFNAGVGYSDIKNQAFYRTGGRYMTVDFDDMTNFFINGDVEFTLNDIIKVGGQIVQNVYKTENLEKAFNMPAIRYNAYSKFSLWKERVNFRADLAIGDKIFYNDASNNVVKGNNLLDLSTELNLRVTNNIGIWIQANNILDREYLRFGNYPGFGQNFAGGVFVKF